MSHTIADGVSIYNVKWKEDGSTSRIRERDLRCDELVVDFRVT